MASGVFLRIGILMAVGGCGGGARSELPVVAAPRHRLVVIQLVSTDRDAALAEQLTRALAARAGEAGFDLAPASPSSAEAIVAVCGNQPELTDEECNQKIARRLGTEWFLSGFIRHADVPHIETVLVRGAPYTRRTDARDVTGSPTDVGAQIWHALSDAGP